VSLPVKRSWLLPAGVVITLLPLVGATFFAREALVCIDLGQPSAARGWAVWLAACLALSGFMAWGVAAIRAQELSESGAQALTLRRGRIFVPWSAVKAASLRAHGAWLKADPVDIQLGFTMYRDPAAAEAFVRGKLPGEATREA
jgi:hypothetical protein